MLLMMQITLALTTASWTFDGVAGAAGGGGNDALMFNSEWDPFNPIGTPDLTITVQNIPYAEYDVYVYHHDANNAAVRGGIISANGVERALTMFNDTGSIPATYVESTDTGPWTTGTSQGTFVRISGLSGDLTLFTDGKNNPTSRLRVSGFQIVNAIPEPSSFGLLALGALLLTRKLKSTGVRSN
jgi:hypothetical protein